MKDQKTLKDTPAPWETLEWKSLVGKRCLCYVGGIDDPGWKEGVLIDNGRDPYPEVKLDDGEQWAVDDDRGVFELPCQYDSRLADTCVEGTAYIDLDGQSIVEVPKQWDGEPVIVVRADAVLDDFMNCDERCSNVYDDNGKVHSIPTEARVLVVSKKARQ